MTAYERELTPAWRLDRLSETYLASMMRGIVAFEMPIARLEGKRKLGQNRAAADVQGAVNALRARGDAASAALADLMSETAVEPS